MAAWPVAQNPSDFVSTGLLENYFHNKKLLNTKKLTDIDPAGYWDYCKDQPAPCRP